MTAAQMSFLAILSGSFLLLLSERLRTDVVGVMIIVALYASGVLTSEQALSGFSSEPAITLAAVFVLGGAFHQAGVSRLIGAWVGKLAGQSATRILAVIMPAVALMSAFTHHVTTTAVMMPITLDLAHKRNVPASKLLMPLAFSASLGTTATIIGAPAFLIADDVLRQAGRPGLQIFSIAPIGITLVLLSMVYMMTLGRWLLPSLHASEADPTRFRLDRYFTELKVVAGSPFCGRRIAEVEANPRYAFEVVGWMRDQRPQPRPFGNQPLQEEDVLLIRTTPEEIVSMQAEAGVTLQPVAKYGSTAAHAPSLEAENNLLVQAVVAPDAVLLGRSVGELAFKERYGAIVVGLWRRDGWLHQRLARIKLQAGDVLVLQSSAAALARIAQDRSFLLLMPMEGERRVRGKAGTAGLIMFGAITLAATKTMHVEMASLSGALMVVLTGCISMRQAYRSIDTRIFVFIAGAIPLGVAMKQTGAADLGAAALQGSLANLPPSLVLTLLFWLVAIATQFMSDAGTTAIFAPVAVAVAQRLGHPPEPYAVTVAMAAVAAFLTPIGHHGNLLVYGPGRYRFVDFVKVGTPMTALICVVVVWMAPRMWPCNG